MFKNLLPKRKSNRKNDFYKFVPNVKLLAYTKINVKDLDRLFLAKPDNFFEIALLGNNIKVPGGKWFLHSLYEVFGEQVYKVKFNRLDPYIIDCGANIGLSIIYLKHFWPDAKILAFEPDTELAKICKSNILSFNLHEVEIINKGVWDKEGSFSFNSEGSLGGHISDEQSPVSNSNSIEVVRLKSFLKDKYIDFLKIDIEGAEIDVIVDCANELKNVGTIFIEYHSINKKEQNFDLILKILKDNGFRYYMTDAWKKMAHPLSEQGVPDNFRYDLQMNVFGFRTN